MKTFEVGHAYLSSDTNWGETRWVCVWRGSGKNPRAHFVEQWEHEMNMAEEMDDYEISRSVNGMNAGNGVHTIHERDGVEVAMWDGDGYTLSASSDCGAVRMKMTEKERETAQAEAAAGRERAEAERIGREVRETTTRAVVSASHGAWNLAKLVYGTFAFIFGNKSAPKYSRRHSVRTVTVRPQLRQTTRTA